MPRASRRCVANLRRHPRPIRRTLVSLSGLPRGRLCDATPAGGATAELHDAAPTNVEEASVVIAHTERLGGAPAGQSCC